MEQNAKEKQIKPPLKVYVVGYSTGYANWVSNQLTDKMEEADLVLLTGGEDVNPSYYGEKPHKSTHFTQRDTFEFSEIKKAIALKKPLYGTCRGLQILTVAAGGSLIQDQTNRYSPHLTSDLTQNLTSNIFELQDLNLAEFDSLTSLASFYGSAPMDFLEFILKNPGQTRIPTIATSAHHQAAYPYNLNPSDYKIVSWTSGMHSRHENGDHEELDIPEEVEIEALMLYKINAFGIQGHPEWMVDSLVTAASQFEKYIQNFENYYKDIMRNPTTVDLSAISSLETNEVIKFDKNQITIKALIYTKSFLYFYGGLSVITKYNFKVGSPIVRDAIFKILNVFMKGYTLKTLIMNVFKYGVTSSRSFKSLSFLKNDAKCAEYFEDLVSEDILDALINGFALKMMPKYAPQPSSKVTRKESLTNEKLKKYYNTYSGSLNSSAIATVIQTFTPINSEIALPAGHDTTTIGADPFETQINDGN